MAAGDYTKILKGKNPLRRQRWYWKRYRGGNHKLIAIGGEPFASKANAERAARDVFPEPGVVPVAAPRDTVLPAGLIGAAALLIALAFLLGTILGSLAFSDDSTTVVTPVTTTTEVHPDSSVCCPQSSSIETTTTTVLPWSPSTIAETPTADPQVPLGGVGTTG